MPPKGHAILSASSSDRWLHCPPSARLCETYEDKGSDYAAEGTDAHELCEYKLKRALGMDASDPTENLTWYNEEMEDCANGYAAYILEMVEAAKESCADPKVLIEQRVDFFRWVEQGFGTADCIIIADGTLRICDYKHGLGVLVDATDNPQMKCYALGALELFDDIYDIDNVSMTIYQPRRQNISTFEIFKDALYKWADEVLKPTADLAFAGDGNFLCGEWCGFCKAKHECRARAEANLTLAQYDFKLPPFLEDSEIEYILSRADELVAWACGEMFRRIHWNNRGCKSIVWRCISRLEPTGQECHARTVNETILENVVVQAINTLLGDKSTYQAQLQQNIAKVIRSAQQNTADEIFKLREQREKCTVDTAARDTQIARINELQDFIKQQHAHLEAFDEALVKRWLERIIIWDDHFTVELKSGLKIEIEA